MKVSREKHMHIAWIYDNLEAKNKKELGDVYSAR